MLECKQSIPNTTTGQIKKCEAFYVGQTQQKTRGRMNGHRDSVQTLKEVPLAQHAASHGVSDLDKCFTLKILKTVPGPTGYAGMRQWELSYQNILKSRVAPGLPGLKIR
jgi:hypothetical protein